MPKVNCTVDRCSYWRDNNVCGATEITVAGLAGRPSPRFEVGTIGRASKPVGTSSETQCVTFKPRQGTSSSKRD